MEVMIIIGIKFEGFAQPIRTAHGARTTNETTSPFCQPRSFKLEVETRKPLATQKRKAEISESSGRPIAIIGTQSIMPHNAPIKVPLTIFSIAGIPQSSLYQRFDLSQRIQQHLRVLFRIVDMHACANASLDSKHPGYRQRAVVAASDADF